MTAAELSAYAAEHGVSLAEAWDDFADAYGWDLDGNPFALGRVIG